MAKAELRIKVSLSNQWLLNGKHGQGTQCTKKGADKSAENTPSAPKFICPNMPYMYCVKSWFCYKSAKYSSD